MNETSKTRIATRWNFLDQESDPCCVVSKRMEVLYVNAAARPLLPQDWFGRRCWQAFPVQDDRCASSCPAVWAVGNSSAIVYCEESIYPQPGSPLLVGVAVIPMENTQAEGEQAILLLRPKPGDSPGDIFKSALLESAERLRSLALAAARIDIGRV